MSAQTPRWCPAVLISAPASGQGKTTATAALARWHRDQGRRVRVFKTGPDFLDPMVLEQASGAPVHQLDLWMVGEARCRALLHEAAGEADLILVEGVMGLFDGTPSSADLAQQFGLPVLAVIDGSAMAQSFGAIAYGLAHYRAGLPFVGVLANRVGSAGHAQMLRDSLPAGLQWFGSLPRDEAAALPSRHLGLVQADEVRDVDARIGRAAAALGAITPALPGSVRFEAAPPESLPPWLAGVRIAVARDAAFSFLYRANLALLEQLGATLHFFSPLADQALPEADAVYLPGGYPELHLAQLSRNEGMRRALQAHHAAGKPLVAECGGMLALLDGLCDADGMRAEMFGLLPGEAQMNERLVNLGLQSVVLPEGELRGHTFHYAALSSPLAPSFETRAQRQHGRAEAVFRVGRLHASFLHLYFPSNPLATARLFAPTSFA